ncbi:unnamed protein product [Sphagnum balticum]
MLTSVCSPGGRFVVVGASDCCVHVYQFDDNMGPIKCGDLHVHKVCGKRGGSLNCTFQDIVDSLAWPVENTGRSLSFATASRDGVAHIWRYLRGQWTSLRIDIDAYARKHAVQIQGLTNCAPVMHVNPVNDHILLTASFDGHISMWHVPSGQRVYDHYNFVQGRGTRHRQAAKSDLPHLQAKATRTCSTLSSVPTARPSPPSTVTVVYSYTVSSRKCSPTMQTPFLTNSSSTLIIGRHLQNISPD